MKLDSVSIGWREFMIDRRGEVDGVKEADGFSLA